MTHLILMRHGQSMWNAKNLFTGWVDIPLTEIGIEEAIAGGRQITNLEIDEIHTSTLVRAQMTAMLVMSQHSSGAAPVIQYGVPDSDASKEETGVSENEQRMRDWAQIKGENSSGRTVPVFISWKLNERMYGDLQGLNKQETRDKYGDEQVHIWRRSFDVPPPNGESLEMTAERTIPYLTKVIIPALERGKNIFIAAHGNSLRSIIMHLESLTKEEVLSLEVPTGKPIIYDFNNGLFCEKSIE